MLPEIHNLNLHSVSRGNETIAELVKGSGYRLEVIRSFGDRSEPDFWYDQNETEWVALISGKATLEFEDGILELSAGDFLTIKPHQKHRVVATSLDAVWLALHFDED